MNATESSTPTGTSHRVVIAQHAGTYIVKPRALNVEVGDTVTFSLVDIDEDISIIFPDPDLFEQPSVDVDPNGDSPPLEVIGEPRKEVHPYAIYRKQGKDFIGFHSRGPVIIIYR